MNNGTPVIDAVVERTECEDDAVHVRRTYTDGQARKPVFFPVVRVFISRGGKFEETSRDVSVQVQGLGWSYLSRAAEGTEGADHWEDGWKWVIFNASWEEREMKDECSVHNVMDLILVVDGLRWGKLQPLSRRPKTTDKPLFFSRFTVFRNNLGYSSSIFLRRLPISRQRMDQGELIIL